MEIDIYDNDFIKSKHFFESNERMHETVIKSLEAVLTTIQEAPIL